MKLRSYLRGLGLGIVVTALLMGVSFKETKMSDEEVIARARQLGMVESTTLAEDAQKQLEQLEESKTEEIVPEEPKEEIVPEKTPEEETAEEEIVEESQVEEETSSLEEKLEEELLGIRETGEDEEVPDEELSDEESTEDAGANEEISEEESVTTVPAEVEKDEIIRLEIVSGDTSVSVSKRLVELGLVENATEYDQYLCKNGYDKGICTGAYEIPSGATYEEIAKIITKRN